MRYIKRLLVMVMLIMLFSVSGEALVYADEIGDTGDTNQGNKDGSNVYTFSYIYDSSRDAIELKVTTKNPLGTFGNTTSHTFTSADDQITLQTKNPRLGSSLENAISSMISSGGYSFSIADVKSKLNDLGYYDAGNGIWKSSGRYFTYMSAVKVRPQKHTIHYSSNGGSGAPADQVKTKGEDVKLSYTKPTKTGYSFKYWSASIGGIYYSGGNYYHNQDGGTVTMNACWNDDIKPSISSFLATPNYWSAGNGTIVLTAQDRGSGLSKIKLQRYSAATKSWKAVKTWKYNGITSRQTESYTEKSEGAYYYKLTVEDVAGNETTKNSAYIYLDHSKPVINGIDSNEIDWTNVAPEIDGSATDYLKGTSYKGSGIKSFVIEDEEGYTVASGNTGTSYELAAQYEGIHTWNVAATDNVGHTSVEIITTKYDCTFPGIEGTDTSFVRPNGEKISGYCKDNIISQHIDDETFRSANYANASSGIKSVIVYRVTGGNREAVYSDSTKVIFQEPDMDNYFDLYYEITSEDKKVDYYEIIAVDFAGNRIVKKMMSRYGVLRGFHTSVDRSAYE